MDRPLWRVQYNSICTAWTAQTGARRPSPGLCDTTCAHLHLERWALQLQFPHPRSPWPALLIRMPGFLIDKLPRRNRPADQCQRWAVWAVLQLVCPEELHWAILLHEAALNHLLGFGVSLFHVVGSFSFRGKHRTNTLEGKCQTSFILGVLPAVVQAYPFLLTKFSSFKEHIVLWNVLKVSMEISKCKRHLLLFKKFSWWPSPMKFQDWKQGKKAKIWDYSSFCRSLGCYFASVCCK